MLKGGLKVITFKSPLRQLKGGVSSCESCGVYIFKFVRFARCCNSVLELHYKNLEIKEKRKKFDSVL